MRISRPAAQKWGTGYGDHLNLSKAGGRAITRRPQDERGRKDPIRALRALLALPLRKIDAPTVRAFLKTGRQAPDSSRSWPSACCAPS